MKKLSLLLLATSLVAITTIVVGCDDGNYEDDVSISDEVADDVAAPCPSGLVLRASDGECVEPEDASDDSTDNEDTVPTDPCEQYAYLEGTEWTCGPNGGDRCRATLWVDTDDSNKCIFECIYLPDEVHFFSRDFDHITFTPPAPSPNPTSFITDPVFREAPCNLATD